MSVTTTLQALRCSPITRSHVASAALPSCGVFIHAPSAVSAEGSARGVPPQSPISVRSREGMSARTVAGSKAFAVLSFTPDPVRSGNDGLEVRGIDARSVAAQVIELESVFDWTNEKLIDRAVSAVRPAVNPEVSVTLRLGRDLERQHPTFVRSRQERSYALLHRDSSRTHGANICL